MRKLCVSVVVLFMTATSALGADFLYHSDGPYKGKVIDLETGEPIEGAVVAAEWTLTHRFCDAKETVTNKNGEFVLPKGSCFSFWPFTQMDPAHVVVFKPGYLGYPPPGASPEERRTRMPGITGYEFKNKKEYNIIKLGRPKTREEKLSTLGMADLSGDETFSRLPMLIKLLNEEAKNLGIGQIGKSRRDR